jgi:hypothetical protein
MDGESGASAARAGMREVDAAYGADSAAWLLLEHVRAGLLGAVS